MIIANAQSLAIIQNMKVKSQVALLHFKFCLYPKVTYSTPSLFPLDFIYVSILYLLVIMYCESYGGIVAPCKCPLLP